MSLLLFDDLLEKHLDDPEFVVGYLDECYRDEASNPGVFRSAVERVFRHAGNAFVDVASAMPYLRSIGFEPKKTTRRPPKTLRTSVRRESAAPVKKSTVVAPSRLKKAA